MHGNTGKDSISALREQTTLAKTRLHGVLARVACPAVVTGPTFKAKAVLIATLFTSSGCARGAAPEIGVEPERAPPIVREVPRPATSPVRASFEYAPGTAAYLVTSEATIAEIDSVATAPRTFREVARVELTIAPADEYTVVTTTGSVEATAASIIQPFVDTLHAEGSDTVVEPRMPICGRDTVPPMHLLTLLPPVPLELRDGVRWTRRDVYATCQGSIPIRVERTDSYTVTGRSREAGGNRVAVTRNSSLMYSGSGVEGQHNVRVAGSGSAQATLVLDISAGRLVSAFEEIRSELDVTASGQTRRFSQQVVRRVEAR